MGTGGRPTKLTEEVLSAAEEYANGGHKDAGDVVPSLAGLAIHLGIARCTVHVWAKQDERFSYITDTVQAMQEKLLINGGLSNAYNANISKLLLSKHGYSEKTEQTVSGTMTNTNINADVSKEDIRDFIKGF